MSFASRGDRVESDEADAMSVSLEESEAHYQELNEKKSKILE